MSMEWEISVRDVNALMAAGQPLLLIDVREPHEHARCRIDGALHVPLGELETRIDELRRLADGAAVVCHCHHGGRSLRAVQFLRSAGLENARSMAGGIDEWSLHIDPAIPRY